MKNIILFWLCLLVAGYRLPAQTLLFNYGSNWTYLDNGSDQGTAWRSLSFNDESWKTGNGKFGYGISGITTLVSYGPDPQIKYITTYFRKTLFLTDLSAFSSFSAGVFRDDGVVVYVNGVEVYRNKMPTGTINYLTRGVSAEDNGKVAQLFTIDKSAFVNGNNIIAVEIHQKNVTTSDMAFDLQLSGNAVTTDQTPPSVVSILRQSPTSQTTNASTLIFRTTFSEKVTGVDNSDFTVTTVSGTANGVLTTGAVTPVGTNGVTYDVTVSDVQGDGTLRLDLNGSGTGITDTAGIAIDAGFTNGETYIIQQELQDQTPPSVVSILRQSPATQTTNASTLIFRTTFSEKVTGVDHSDFTVNTVSGTANGVLENDAVTPVDTNGVTYDVTVSNVQGDGELRLDLNGSGTGITDTAGNVINTGFINGETYVIQQLQQGPPIVTSINRQLPANEQTNATAVTFRVIFSKKVKGVDGADFILFNSDGNVRGTLTNMAETPTNTSLLTAVRMVGTDSTTYDVTVRAIAGSGVLRLDVKNSNTGITDAGENALSGGFTNGQTYTINASATQGFISFADINPLTINPSTKEMPQAKLWNYSGKWWAVLATSAGTKVFRLDNTSWTDVLTIATASNARADCRVVGNLVHIVLFRGEGSTSFFVSLEYDPVLNTYKRWTQRTSNVNIVFEAGAHTATLDIDATNRIWVASNHNGNMLVRWSDPPYSTFSSPITVASGATSLDICSVTALPGKIGVFWSNQNTKRFGFKTHTDGAAPTEWSADEVPASQSAVNAGAGMADEHLSLVPASDGTLYCAIKTGYDKLGLPAIALLVRRPNNTWDNLYPVTSSKEGNRPIVVLNEAAGKVKVFYSTHLINFDGTRSGDILYRESSTSSISFGAPVTLISGNGMLNHEYTASTHQTYNPAVVVLATNDHVSPLKAVGVLATDEDSPEILARSPSSQAVTENSYEDKWFIRPNPFGASTIVDFRLAHSGRYSITLYDSKGKNIRVIRQGSTKAGINNYVSIDGSHLASGIYFVTIQTDRQIKTMKLFRK